MGDLKIGTVKTSDMSERELRLDRLLDVTPEAAFRCWTTPELMKEWFCPKPWQVTHAETDVRSGGSNHIVMQGPKGEESIHRGVYLEVIPNEKIVFTDAFVSAWVPSNKPFMVATVTFAPEGNKTRYKALVHHWTVDDRKQH